MAFKIKIWSLEISKILLLKLLPPPALGLKQSLSKRLRYAEQMNSQAHRQAVKRCLAVYLSTMSFTELRPILSIQKTTRKIPLLHLWKLSFVSRVSRLLQSLMLKHQVSICALKAYLKPALCMITF